jgi:hypothetical protein
MDDEKPDTRHLVLKPKEVVPTDPPSRPGDGTAISVQLIHRQNRLAEEKRSRRRRRDPRPPAPAPPPEQALDPAFKPKEITPLNAPALAGDDDAIAVPDMLKENQAAEVQSGLAEVKHRKRRKSRRNRDFILLVGSLDLGIAFLMKMMPGVITMIYGLSAITLVTSTFGWIMFVVNDDY